MAPNTLSIGPHQPVSDNDPLKEYWGQFNKIGSTILNTVIPDFTDPVEVSNAALDAKMAISRGGSPAGAAGLYIGKRAINRLINPIFNRVKSIIKIPDLATGLGGTGGAKAMQMSKQTAKTAKPLTPAQQGRRQNTKNRRRRQQPPLASLRQLSRDMMLPDEVLVAYEKDAKRGFRTQQAFASNWHETADAGHFFSTKADSGAHRYRPGKQGNAPTSGRSAAPEARTANRSGGAKAHHDLNPHIAREVGIPQTWADDFKLFVKEYYDLPHTNFNTHFSNKGRELLKAVPQNLSRSESMKVLNEILSDPSNIGENLSKQQMRDIRIDRARSNLNVDL